VSSQNQDFSSKQKIQIPNPWLDLGLYKSRLHEDKTRAVEKERKLIIFKQHRRNCSLLMKTDKFTSVLTSGNESIIIYSTEKLPPYHFPMIYTIKKMTYSLNH
jgi:uncharacterized Zn-finger protein